MGEHRGGMHTNRPIPFIYNPANGINTSDTVIETSPTGIKPGEFMFVDSKDYLKLSATDLLTNPKWTLFQGSYNLDDKNNSQRVEITNKNISNWYYVPYVSGKKRVVQFFGLDWFDDNTMYTFRFRIRPINLLPVGHKHDFISHAMVKNNNGDKTELELAQEMVDSINDLANQNRFGNEFMTATYAEVAGRPLITITSNKEDFAVESVLSIQKYCNDKAEERKEVYIEEKYDANNELITVTAGSENTGIVTKESSKVGTSAYDTEDYYNIEWASNKDNKFLGSTPKVLDEKGCYDMLVIQHQKTFLTRNITGTHDIVPQQIEIIGNQGELADVITFLQPLMTSLGLEDFVSQITPAQPTP